MTGVKPQNILRAGTDRDDDDILDPMSSPVTCHTVSHNIFLVSKFYLDFADHSIFFDTGFISQYVYSKDYNKQKPYSIPMTK